MRDGVARRLGRRPFRASGEVHKWYYDRVSLAGALTEAGFVKAAAVDYRTSRVPGWTEMNLDRSAYGDRPRAPDAVIVEAEKPGGRPDREDSHER